MLSANMKVRIRGILNIGVLLILKFSSILKVKFISAFFVNIILSFILLVFLDSASNFVSFMFLKFKNPFSHSKVTGKIMISFRI